MMTEKDALSANVAELHKFMGEGKKYGVSVDTVHERLTGRGNSMTDISDENRITVTYLPTGESVTGDSRFESFGTLLKKLGRHEAMQCSHQVDRDGHTVYSVHENRPDIVTGKFTSYYKIVQ